MILREGMVVFTADGLRLGRVSHLDERTFRVEEDRLFRRQLEHEFRHTEARAGAPGEIHVSRESTQLGDASPATRGRRRTARSR